jgi:hypothetical protein
MEETPWEEAAGLLAEADDRRRHDFLQEETEGTKTEAAMSHVSYLRLLL